MEWGKRALAPRNSLGDLYFASEGRPADEDRCAKGAFYGSENSPICQTLLFPFLPFSIGHDLAVMSLCNHTILTYGTFSHWMGFLAGGSRVLPMHFPEYRFGKNCRRGV